MSCYCEDCRKLEGKCPSSIIENLEASLTETRALLDMVKEQGALLERCEEYLRDSTGVYTKQILLLADLAAMKEGC